MKDKPVILLVDDHPQNIELLEAYLIPHGYEIVKATNGEEALAKLSSDQIDLILLDVLMPGMDGFEVTRRIRQDDKIWLIPVILITVLWETEDRVKGIEAGCDDFLSQPVDKTELLARVRSLLKVKAYNDLMSNYQTELESEVTRRTDELKHALENLRQDITERKRTEEALRQSETKYRSIFDNAAEGIFQSTPEGKFLTANPAMARILGFSSPEELIRECTDIARQSYVHPEQREEFKRLMEQHDKLFGFEFEVLRQDGSVVWVSETAQAVRDATGRIVCYDGIFIDITERKLAEAALRESERQISVIYDTVGDVLFNLKAEPDGSYRFIAVNRCFLSTTGLQADQVIGKRVQDIIPEPSLTFALEKYAEAIRKKKNVRWEETSEYPTGRLTGEVSIAPLFDDAMNCISLVGSVHDITERKRVEEELTKSESKFRAIFDNASDGMFLVDLKTRKFFMCNTKCTKMLGYAQEEFLNLDIADIHTKEDLSFIYEQIGKFSRGEEGIRSDLRFKRKNGSIFAADLSSALITIAEKKYLLRIFKDITERKRAEEELRESKMLVDAVVENVPLMIFLKESLDLRFVIFNRAGEELLGYDRKALLGKNNLDLFPPEQAAHFMAKDREVLNGEVGMLDIPEEPIQTANKGQRLLHTRKVCIRGADGITKYLLGISEDITERKRAEEQIQKDLKVKEVMLKEIHHRVRNNLNVITSLLTLQSDRITTKRQALEAFGETKNRIYAMALVHTNLYQEKDFSHINLTSFIQDLTHNLMQIYQTNVKIDMHIEDLSLDINNAVPCGLILNELVSNALKHAFTNKSKGLITIDFRILKENTYKLTVQDNGVGLPKEINIRRTKSLGLLIVNQLIDQIDGVIKITRGKGTQFQITFPVSTT